ncbi:hypothetical protein BH10BAC5_BH10BAC5_28480 [soil metagenome]
MKTAILAIVLLFVVLFTSAESIYSRSLETVSAGKVFSKKTLLNGVYTYERVKVDGVIYTYVYCDGILVEVIKEDE